MNTSNIILGRISDIKLLENYKYLICIENKYNFVFQTDSDINYSFSKDNIILDSKISILDALDDFISNKKYKSIFRENMVYSLNFEQSPNSDNESVTGAIVLKVKVCSQSASMNDYTEQARIECKFLNYETSQPAISPNENSLEDTDDAQTSYDNVEIIKLLEKIKSDMMLEINSIKSSLEQAPATKKEFNDGLNLQDPKIISKINKLINIDDKVLNILYYSEKQKTVDKSIFFNYIYEYSQLGFYGLIDFNVDSATNTFDVKIRDIILSEQKDKLIFEKNIIPYKYIDIENYILSHPRFQKYLNYIYVCKETKKTFLKCKLNICFQTDLDYKHDETDHYFIKLLGISNLQEFVFENFGPFKLLDFTNDKEINILNTIKRINKLKKSEKSFAVSVIEYFTTIMDICNELQFKGKILLAPRNKDLNIIDHPTDPNYINDFNFMRYFHNPDEAQNNMHWHNLVGFYKTVV